jgi:hypothetical protein
VSKAALLPVLPAAGCSAARVGVGPGQSLFADWVEKFRAALPALGRGDSA